MMKDLKKFGKVAALFAWAFVAIASSAGAMNSGEGFYITMGLANLLINGYAIYKVAKSLQD